MRSIFILLVAVSGAAPGASVQAVGGHLICGAIIE